MTTQNGPTMRPGAACPKPRRDWLEMLRDAGPNGAALDQRHAAIWGAILDLRGVRDTIENALEQMTAKLDTLADKTTLTHAIAAGWEPEDEATVQPLPGHAAACEDGCAEPLKCLVERARLGLTALRTLWNAHASVPPASRDGEDFAFGASMTFVVDEIETLLDRIAAMAKPTA